MFVGLTLCLFLFQDSEIPIQEKFTVNYVLLDVVVEHRKKGVVKDLKASDFTVYDNRDKVEIASFEILQYTGGPSGLAPQTVASLERASAETIQPVSRAQFVFVLDFESASLPEIQRAFGQLESFLANLKPEQPAAFLLYSMEHGRITDYFVEDVSAFTDVLLGYKERYFRATTHTGVEAKSLLKGKTRTNRLLNAGLNEVEARFRQCRNTFNPNDRRDLTAQANLNRCIDDELRIFLDSEQDRVERALGELEALTYQFQEAPGLKTMLFVSPGFALEPGAAASRLASYYKNVAQGETEPRSSGLQSLGMDEEFLTERTMDVVSLVSYEKEFRKVIHACIRNRVVFHAFDIYNFNMGQNRNISTEYGKSSRVATQAHKDYGHELNSGLQTLADESGGLFFSGASLTTPMTKMVNEPVYIYVIGYQTPSGKPGEYRKIKVKCKARGVRLRYRQGYFGS